MSLQDRAENLDREIQALLGEIHEKYGYDFREYTSASIKRRIVNACSRFGIASVAELRDRVLAEDSFFSQMISEFTVSVTEMFRDPELYLAIRQHVVPVLRTYPSVRIWHAGCSTGEEVYSMAILLKEEGLYEKSFLYATDISPRALDAAREAIYPVQSIQGYTANYQKAGGRESFAKYYSARYDSVKLDSSLQKNVLFAQHNLAADQVFSEVHMIFCRNVLIYFSKALQERTLGLFEHSLVRKGFLALGSKETLEFSPLEKSFETVMKNERIYKKL